MTAIQDPDTTTRQVSEAAGSSPQQPVGSPVAPQPREQSVLCYRCLSRRTWNLSALCDECEQSPREFHMCRGAWNPPNFCETPSAYRITATTSSGWQVKVTACHDHASMIFEFLEGFTQGEEMPMSVEKLGG